MLHFTRDSGVGAFDDVLHLCNLRGWVDTFSLDKLRFLWEQRVHSIDFTCVAGHLFFSTTNNRSNLVAWDRYTGEKLWDMETRYRPHVILASNSRLAVLTVDDRIMSYPWEEQ